MAKKFGKSLVEANWPIFKFADLKEGDKFTILPTHEPNGKSNFNYYLKHLQPIPPEPAIADKTMELHYMNIGVDGTVNVPFPSEPVNAKSVVNPYDIDLDENGNVNTHDTISYQVDMNLKTGQMKFVPNEALKYTQIDIPITPVKLPLYQMTYMRFKFEGEEPEVTRIILSTNPKHLMYRAAQIKHSFIAVNKKNGSFVTHSGDGVTNGIKFVFRMTGGSAPSWAQVLKKIVHRTFVLTINELGQE